MQRIILSIFILLLMSAPVLASTSKLDVYNSFTEAKQAAAMQWRLSVGKSTEDMVVLPNGNLLITAGSKQMTINPQGKLVWEYKNSNGNLGRPVIGSNGSIYAASTAAIQETLSNGAGGWEYKIYLAGKSGKSPMLAPGPKQLLYLPLPDALYALDTKGHYIWSLYSWDKGGKDTITAKTAKKNFMACAGDEQAFYVVLGDKANYRLVAVNQQGKLLWSYFLGDIKQAGIVTDGQGRVYVSVSYKKKSAADKSKSNLLPGQISCFQYDSNKPVWTVSLKSENGLSAPVLNDGALYVNADSKINTYRASDGSGLWEDKLLELFSPVAVNTLTGRIYAGSSEGELYALNPAGRMIWSRELDGAIERAPLITADGTIYVITDKGSLYKMVDQYKDI